MVNRIVKRMIIGCGLAIVLVLIVAVISTVVMLRKPGDAKKRIAEQHQEGIEFGKGADQRGCIKEGLKRGNKISIFDFGAQDENESFVNACLETSRESSGFCDGVPSPLKNIVVDWTKKQCQKVNDFGPVCEDVFKQQMYFCERQTQSR
jgi:hypothetical protein